MSEVGSKSEEVGPGTSFDLSEFPMSEAISGSLSTSLSASESISSSHSTSTNSQGSNTSDTSMDNSSTANSLVMTGNSGNAEMNNGAKHSAVDDLVAKNNKATANKELLQRGNGLEQGGLLLGLGLMVSSLLLATKKKKANK